MTLDANRNRRNHGNVGNVSRDLMLPRFTVTINVEGMPDNPWDTTRVLASKSIIEYIHFMRNFLIIYAQRVRQRVGINDIEQVRFCDECRTPYLVNADGERVLP